MGNICGRLRVHEYRVADWLASIWAANADAALSLIVLSIYTPLHYSLLYHSITVFNSLAHSITCAVALRLVDNSKNSSIRCQLDCAFSSFHHPGCAGPAVAAWTTTTTTAASFSTSLQALEHLKNITFAFRILDTTICAILSITSPWLTITPPNEGLQSPG